MSCCYYHLNIKLIKREFVIRDLIVYENLKSDGEKFLFENEDSISKSEFTYHVRCICINVTFFNQVIIFVAISFSKFILIH